MKNFSLMITEIVTPENESKVEYLKSIGFDVEDYDNTTVLVLDDYNSEIHLSDFEIGDSFENIQNGATWFSCCGDELDKDFMICPSCREHC